MVHWWCVLACHFLCAVAPMNAIMIAAVSLHEQDQLVGHHTLDNAGNNHSFQSRPLLTRVAGMQLSLRAPLSSRPFTSVTLITDIALLIAVSMDAMSSVLKRLMYISTFPSALGYAMPVILSSGSFLQYAKARD
eukprot:scaffold59670_cov16-Prasinocladus_malaysianus.AAC.1